MYAASFSYEQYFCHLIVDAMLARFAVIDVASCFLDSSGIWSGLKLLFSGLCKTSVDGSKGQASVL